MLSHQVRPHTYEIQFAATNTKLNLGLVRNFDPLHLNSTPSPITPPSP